MRKSILALSATLAASCAIATAASADALAPGNYTAQLTSVTIGTGGVLAPRELPLGGVSGLPVVPFTVPSNPAPVSVSFGSLTIPPIDLYTVAPSQVGPGSTLTLTLTGPLTASADPTTGSVSAHVAGYMDATLNNIASLGQSDTCHLGSPASPIDIDVSTANPNGQPYSPATGVMKVADDAVSIPAATCDGNFLGLVVPFLNTFAGLPTTSGELVLSGVIKPVPASTGQGGQQTGQQQTAGQQQTSGQAPSKQCVVPKLKGKKLGAAKKALKNANCRLGTVTKKKAGGKKGAGKVRGSNPKAGTKLPAGSKVSLVVGKKG